MHKNANESLKLVSPWFMVKPESSWNPDMIVEGIEIGLTAVLQIGWLINNEHDVYFGMGMNVSEEFEDLGEL